MKKLNYILILIVSLILFVPNAYAVETIERTSSNNWGVNKDIKITDDNLDDIKSTPYVKSPDLHIYDFGNLLTDDEESRLASFAKALEIELGFDVVVYLISDDEAYDYETELDLAANFFDYNDFGIEDEYYDGILLIINKPSPRFDNNYPIYFTLRSFGEAQFYFNESRADTVLDNVESYFYSYNFATGIEEFYESARSMYRRGSWDVDDEYYLDETGTLIKRRHFPFLTITGISALITALVVLVYVKKNKMVMKAHNASNYINLDDVSFTRRDDIFRNSRTTHVRINTSSSSGGDGRSTGSYRGSSGRSSSGSMGRRR